MPVLESSILFLQLPPVESGPRCTAGTSSRKFSYILTGLSRILFHSAQEG
jgi:hypothetical protein